MTWVAGVDGCRRGWFRICRETDSGELAFGVVEKVAELLDPPAPRVVALDIPIGLPAAGARTCDLEARICLGARRSSVFPAPIRPALAAGTREQASEITRQVDGRKLSVQAWAILHKIRDVDEALATSPAARTAVREVHPEVCFWAWNGRSSMQHPKKKRAGREERLALCAAWLGEDILRRARGGVARKELADDDILDAIAALWTAHGIAQGRAETLPASPPRDDTGLPMEIVF